MVGSRLVTSADLSLFVFVAACTPTPKESVAPEPPAPVAPVASAGASTMPDPEPAATILDCGAAVAAEATFEKHYREVLGVVLLSTSDGGTNSTGPVPQGDRFFGKSGLYVRQGAKFELVAPDDGMLILWGSGQTPYARLQIPGCTAADARLSLSKAAPTDWLVFTGGFFVREHGCYPLIVRVGDKEERVRIAVGADCPAR